MSRVYLGFLDYSRLEEPSDMNAFLDEEECRRFHFHTRSLAGKGFLAGRILAKSMISDFLDCSIDNIKFKLGRSGKPSFPGVFFSISHSGHYALCAVSNYPVGVDIELWKSRQNLSYLASHIFYYDEAVLVSGSGRDTIDLSIFYDFWVMKEAWLKCRSRTVWDMAEVPRAVELSKEASGCGIKIPVERSYSAAVVSFRPLRGEDILFVSEFLPPDDFITGTLCPFRFESDSKG